MPIPTHEIAAERILREELGDDVYICRGSEILPEIREYERTSTAVVNAYIGPVVRNYADALAARLPRSASRAPVEMMHSGGGIMRLGSAVKRAASLVESGPAAGVIACARLVSGGDEPSIISFDMGGTTAKAALIENGEPARTDRIRGRRRHQSLQQARQGRRLSDQDAVHRRVGDRRRRRQHRRARQDGPGHGRPAERRRLSRARSATGSAARRRR